MASFRFSDNEELKARAANYGNQPKIGFFKLGAGEEALVRFNVASVEDLHGETVHKPVFGKKFEGLSNPYAGISCLSTFGSHDESKCPLCRAAAQEGSVVSKATKLYYIPMLVSYKDKTTGQYSEAQPVIWERPSGFASELAAKIASYGDLSQVVLKMTRVGGGKDTRYSLDYIPVLQNPANCPVEKLSAFDNFDVSKHSYWVKTAEELESYLATGSFPVVEKAAAATTEAPAQTAYAAPAQPVYTAPAAPVYQTPVQPVYTAPATPVQAAPTAPAEEAPARPTRTFTPGRF